MRTELETANRTTRPTAGTRPGRAVGLVPLLAATWSALCAAAAIWWLFEPDAYVLDEGVSEEPSGLMMLIPPRVGAVAFLLVGVLGIGVAAALARVGRHSPTRGLVLGAGAVLALVLAVAVPDVQLLSFLGYALAILGGPILLVLLLAGVARHRRNLVWLGVLALAVGVGVALGEIGEPTVRLLRNIAGGLERVGPRPLVLAGMLLGGLLFAAATLLAARRVRVVADRNGRRLQRWGRAATVVAALCPLPYATIRMTWLTPWPQGLGPGHEAMLDDVRVFGVCLGLAALGGAWLTLGLIRPWGETWPAWLPRLRGRPVPVLAAVIPAGVVAAILCAAAISHVMMAAANDELWLIWAIPAPIWGPALALATYAYARRRGLGAGG